MLQLPCPLCCFYVCDSEECHVSSPHVTSPPHLKTGARGAKVRGAVLSAEIELTRFISNITNTHVSWSENIDGCTWNGVKCDSDLRVTTLDWNSLALVGTFLYRHMPSTTKSFVAWGITGEIPLQELPPGIDIEINLSTN